jgi:amidase
MKKILFSRCFFILACKPTQKTVIPAWVPYDETEEVVKTAANASTKNAIQSYPIKILDNDIWKKYSKSDK